MTRADLLRKIMELEAQLASRCAQDLTPAGDVLYASGAILSITTLGGREIIKPVLIRDGLSRVSIDALHADLKRSFDLATLKQPKG